MTSGYPVGAVRNRVHLDRARPIVDHAASMGPAEPPHATQLAAIAAGGAALASRSWPQARDHYRVALEAGAGADALEGYAIACWWLDDVGAAIDARERAYAERRAAGQTVEAARLAGFLAWDYGAMRGSSAIANGWLARARRLVEDLPASAEHAWLPLIEASFHIDTDAREVLRLAGEAGEHARALGGLDIEMTARTLQGLALVTLGQVDEGRRLLDEGAAAATSGELFDPIAIGSCCCNMIIACERARDFDRAGEWCERLQEYCERTGQRPLLALCRAHHGTVLTMRGEWDGADRELDWAAGELAQLRPPLARYARARLAELRRRQGRFGEARELVVAAADHVLVPLLRAQLALDDGDPQAALGYARRYLSQLTGDTPIESAGALEVLVPVHVRLGEIGDARAVHERLAAIADAVATDAVRATERFTAATIGLAAGETEQARWAAEESVALYESSSSPLEAALARLALARALASLDREPAALEQALTAAGVLERLGARPAAKAAGKLVTQLGGRSAAGRRAGLTPRELEVLGLLAQGLSNREVAERLVVSEHTVHRHVANVFAKLGVSSRAAAVAEAAQRELLG